MDSRVRLLPDHGRAARRGGPAPRRDRRAGAGVRRSAGGRVQDARDHVRRVQSSLRPPRAAGSRAAEARAAAG